MPSATHTNNGKDHTDSRSARSPEAMKQMKNDFTRRAAKIKKLYASDQYSTATIHGLRVKFLELQCAEYESDKREVMLNRNLDLMAEFSRLADKRKAIEDEFNLARRQYKEQMEELAQRLDASLTGLAEEAKEAGISGPCNFKDDSITG